ncbi:MAG: leucine-rich repeat protein [Prevotella sp.]|nr:leucine-rich repeat protein [Prevotella sp.]
MKQKLFFLFVLMLSPLMASAFVGDAIIDGIKYKIITKDQTAEVLANNYSGNIIIPTTIEYEGVVCNVTSIGDEAFKGCKSLTSISIPSSVTKIGDNAFYECNGLKSTIISDLAAWCKISFNDYSNPLFYAHHLYLDNEEIKELNIPSSIKSIGSHAFEGCSGLTSVTIPNSVTKIEDFTFHDCSGLTSVTLSDSVSSVGNYAFNNCSNLVSLTLGNSLTSIGERAFNACSSLTSISIPSSVTKIGDYAFYGCNGLKSTIISDLVAWCKISFQNFSNPLFYAHHLYLDNEEIKELHIPSSIKSIGSHTFEGCSGLTFITIPNSVISIGPWAFYGCSGLTSMTIGSGIRNIYTKAFASCPELTDFYCYAENVPTMRDEWNLCTDAFDGSYIEYAMLYVPAVSVSAYRAAEPWKNFKSIVAIDGETPETQKCATPVIIYENGKLMFACATEGVEYVTDITCADIKKHYSSAIDLTGTYTVSVYATKVGYENSDVATKEIQISSGSGSDKLGDLNNDGVVNAADAVTLVNIIINKP